MTPGEPAIAYRRLRAPAENGAALIVPPLEQVPSLLGENQALRRGYDASIAGMPLRQLTRQARSELLDAAWRYTSAYRNAEVPDESAPVLMAGHQPQLFHPGVWFKNFVLGRLARQAGGVAINLIIDSDTLRSASLRVPGGSIATPTAHAVAFDAPGPEAPFEERPILDRELFASFERRVRAELEPLVADPLVRRLWPLVLERARHGENLGLCLAQGRHCLEAEWGLSTLELPQSQICEQPAFRWFAVHLLTEAARLRDTYNTAVGEYRRASGIRSASHPVPDLIEQDGWIETPLWIWRRDEPRRRRLFVRPDAKGLLLSDRRHDPLPLPSPTAGADATVEALGALSQRGIRLRTRALMTTLWSRLVLSDLFLHGIGGAKYDQVTDLLISRMFGQTPPAYLTVTATLKLPIERPSVQEDDLHRLDQQLRGLIYHPERHVDCSAERDPSARGTLSSLIETKQQWIATVQTRENARQRCQSIRQVNEALQPWVEEPRRQLEQQRSVVTQRLRAEAVLGSREYSFCLYPERSLRDFMLEFQPAKS